MSMGVSLLASLACDVGHLRGQAMQVTMAAMNFLSRAWLGGLERGMAGLDRVARRNGSEAAHLKTGMRGEDAAYFYLRRKGYTVLRDVGRRGTSRATSI